LIDFKTVSYPEKESDYHTADNLGGKAYGGNIPEISQSLEYPELVFLIEISNHNQYSGSPH